MAVDSEMVTCLLQQWSSGNKEALDQLMPLVYSQLHKLALRAMRDERGGHTLRATALVHEAYVRLVQSDVSFNDRAHFYAVAARLLRRILVDHARKGGREKRGSAAPRMTFDEVLYVSPTMHYSLVELDDALQDLAANDQRKSDIVELLYFGGLTYEEIAVEIGISESTVHRELKMARAWLLRELARGGQEVSQS